MIGVLHYIAAQPAENKESLAKNADELKEFVFDAYQRNVLVATLVIALIIIIVLFIKWQRDKGKDQDRIDAASAAHVKVADDNREAVAAIVADFNGRLDAKDRQVMDFALEMRDTVNRLHGSTLQAPPSTHIEPDE